MSKRSPLVFNPEKKSAHTSETAQSIQETGSPRIATKGKSREGRQFIAAHVVSEAAKQFKLLAVQQGRTTQSLLVEAINDLFTKYGLSRIADE